MCEARISKPYTCMLMDVFPAMTEPQPLSKGQLEALKQSMLQRERIALRSNLTSIAVPINLSGLDMPLINFADILTPIGYTVNPATREGRIISEKYLAPYNLQLWTALLSITRRMVNNRVMTTVLPANNQTDQMLREKGTDLATIAHDIIDGDLNSLGSLSQPQLRSPLLIINPTPF